MKNFMHSKAAVLTALVGAGAAGSASAAEILVNADIAVSTTWTANNTYNLQQQIYVLPGATLTIEAGTLIQSDTNIGGSLAVTNGAQIFVQGTKAKPVIFTSKADTLNAWHEGANEWGNLTIMGDAYISENVNGDPLNPNDPFPSAANFAPMEGLVAGFAGDTKILYGGGDDNDDSGSVSYCSLRYGGKVVSLSNELNGLSLGGIGRNTDIDHVEILNNVDDGVEIWGGTVNLKYLSIWYVGDDSIDIDQGHRGKVQFGLVVQGYSKDAVQGSGVGDNCIEMDGAEQSDYQPVTTGAMYNLTVIGQPIDGDQGTAWRDNARMQIRNAIFMDIGEELVRLDNVDGDGGLGYGNGGTLTWAQTWATAYNAVPAHANDFTTGTYATNYASQVDGNLAEIKDSVFFSNLFGAAYTQATTVGVLPANGSNNNVLAAGADLDMLGNYAYVSSTGPIQSITRAAQVIKGTKKMLQVTQLDPRPTNDAVLSVGSAPADGFFTPSQYRGAFDPSCGITWLDGWTATYAYGITPTVGGPSNYCTGKVNSNACTPSIAFVGPDPISFANAATTTANFTVSNVSPRPGASSHLGQLFYGTSGAAGAPFLGGTLCVKSLLRVPPLVNTGGTVGSTTLCDSSITQNFNARIASGSDPKLTAGATVWMQGWARDTAGFLGVQLSNACTFTICP